MEGTATDTVFGTMVERQMQQNRSTGRTNDRRHGARRHPTGAAPGERAQDAVAERSATTSDAGMLREIPAHELDGLVEVVGAESVVPQRHHTAIVSATRLHAHTRRCSHGISLAFLSFDVCAFFG
jgi:hypothetical protein